MYYNILLLQNEKYYLLLLNKYVFDINVWVLVKNKCHQNNDLLKLQSDAMMGKKPNDSYLSMSLPQQHNWNQKLVFFKLNVSYARIICYQYLLISLIYLCYKPLPISKLYWIICKYFLDSEWNKDCIGLNIMWVSSFIFFVFVYTVFTRMISPMYTNLVIFWYEIVCSWSFRRR